MFHLSNLTIVILSPQPWGMMHVSKHHYAIELTRRNNTVFFVNPPDYKKKGIAIEAVEEYPGLYEVTYSPFFPWRIRFHARWVFDRLMQVQVAKIMRAINVKPDVCWCFDPNTFTNLNWFGARLNIYHPVDPIIRKDQIHVADSAHMVLSVSNRILSAFKQKKTPAHFINHGLSSQYAALAQKNLDRLDSYRPSSPLKAGYVGNLLRKPIDRDLFLKILKSQPDIEFHLWGPCQAKQSNISANEDRDTIEFIEKLQQLPNVVLKGVRSPSLLAEEIQDMDMFFLTYQLIDGESDRSNSHKILEYLSTGKVIVSIHIETYQGSGLLVMSDPDHDEQIIRLFEETKLNLQAANSVDKMKERIQYALQHEMKLQIDKIEEKINCLSKVNSTN